MTPALSSRVGMTSRNRPIRRSTDRQTDRHRQRQTDWQTDRQTGGPKDTHTHGQIGWPTDRQTQTHTQVDRQTHRKTNKLTNWHTDRPKDRQTTNDRKTDKKTDRHVGRERQTSYPETKAIISFLSARRPQDDVSVNEWTLKTCKEKAIFVSLTELSRGILATYWRKPRSNS